MLKKEICVVLVQAVFSLGAVFLMTWIMTNFIEEPFFEIMFPMFQVGLLMWALIMGNFTFSLDREQRGMEYLLSLPYSRLQLLGIKILPRLGGLLIFYTGYLILKNSISIPAEVFTPTVLLLLYFPLFILAFSASTVSDNFVISSFFSFVFLFIHLVLLGLSAWLALNLKGLPVWEMSDLPYLWQIGGIILLLPFLMAFLLSFKNFDIRPARVFNLRFVKKLVLLIIPGFILSTGIFMLGIKTGWYTEHYLTQNRKLVQMVHPFKSVKIFEGEKVIDLNPGFWLWNSIEIDQYLVGEQYSYYNPTEKITISRLDLNNYEIKPLFTGVTDKYVSFSLRINFKKSIVFIERGQLESQLELVFIDVNIGETNRFSVSSPLIEGTSEPQIFGQGEIQGRAFWLISNKKIGGSDNILQIWEDGVIQTLGDSRFRPFYINQMMFVYRQEKLKVFRLTPEGCEQLKEFDVTPRFGRGLVQKSFSGQKSKEIFGISETNQENKVISLDLENLSISCLGNVQGVHNQIWHMQEGAYFIEYLQGKRKLYLIKNKSLTLIKEFSMSMPKKGTDPYSTIRIFSSGMVVSNAGKIKVYSLPDLKEIKFKGLK